MIFHSATGLRALPNTVRLSFGPKSSQHLSSLTLASLLVSHHVIAGRLAGIATVRLDLPEGSHCGSDAIIGFVPRLLVGRSRLALI
jgi:hypothetical protein